MEKLAVLPWLDAVLVGNIWSRDQLEKKYQCWTYEQIVNLLGQLSTSFFTLHNSNQFVPFYNFQAVQDDLWNGFSAEDHSCYPVTGGCFQVTRVVKFWKMCMVWKSFDSHEIIK